MAASLSNLVIDEEKAQALFNEAVRLEEEKVELVHKEAKALLRFAEDEEVGRANNGIPDPAKAIETYEAAIDIYNYLIDYLDSQLSDRKSEYASYKEMITQKKDIAEKEKSCLVNIIIRNRHYENGLFYEKKIGNTEKTTSFTDFIGLCKEAMSEYKKAENLGHNGARSCYARLLYNIEGEISKAITLYQKASTEGDAAAMNELGILYEKGKVNRKIELDKAILYYDDAIALNYTKAMLNRAALYENDKEYDKVFELYEKAYNLGDCHARDEMNKFAQRLYLMAQELCDKKDEMDDVLQLENIEKLCVIMVKLAECYQEGRINSGVAEPKPAAQLIEEVNRGEKILAANSLKRPRTNELNKENVVRDEVKASPQKKQKTRTHGIRFFGSSQPIINIMELRSEFVSSPVSGVKRPNTEPTQAPITVETLFSQFSSPYYRPSIFFESPAKKQKRDNILPSCSDMAITSTHS